ncbi:VCBS repeat-containing protein [Glycomyces sp. NPDC049804]|uniref:FG-GAP repeat domain-containing protein n=1 Tax=Glycomyces sp. NPDC049804 TaxID=3154363 RepID=UPI00342999C2
MNDASPAKPRRRHARLAAATATAVGAALLAFPGGPASAQTGIDCDALGDDPAPVRIGPALDIARKCGIEVRIHSSATHHATISVMPSGQLHLLSTVDPVQKYGDLGDPGTALVESSGSLSLDNTGWPVFLQYTDQTYPLIETKLATLDWIEEAPVPTYTGATAVYDELAPGLDLTVEVGLAVTDIRFTASDADAWGALSTGLRAQGSYGATVEAVDNSLRINRGDDPFDVEGTTPFLVRDAAGETHQAHVTIGEDGAVTAELLDQTLAEAVFPLTLTTQWANRSREANEWGAVTSASPDVALYGGEAGLDEPYFAAAGQNADAVAGAYCDATAGPECAEAQAIAYWNFDASIRHMREPSVSYEYDFPVTSAIFQIDAAEGSTCVAPDLNFTTEYSTAATWNDRPTVTGLAASGACQADTAVYDLTGPLSEAWGDYANAEPITIGTAETAPTARFDGGSARLDVYFDIAGINTTARCSSDPAAPDFYQDAVDASVHVEEWREEIYDLGLSWSATVKDETTGEMVLELGPEPWPDWDHLVGAIEWGLLAQGSYEIDYSIASSTADLDYAAPPCHVVVDTEAPSPVITVEPGPHRIGDTVSIEVALDEQDFVNELDWLNISVDDKDSQLVDSATLTEAGTAVLEAELTGPVTRLRIQVEDRAGKDFYTYDPIEVIAAFDHFDNNGDGIDDLMAVRTSDGALLFYAGKGDGTLDYGYIKGTGWGGMDVVMAGDLTRDGKADVLARDTKTGTLYTYPGNGSGGFGTRITVGTGWNAMGAFTSGGDFNNDGDIDMFAVNKSDGKLYFYDGQGNGSGKFNPRTAIGTGWGVMDTLASVGDLNDDGKADLLARDSRTGQYYLYKGTGMGSLGTRTAVPASLDGSGSDRYSQIIAAGDQDGDGKEDLFAVDSRTGELELHSLSGTGTAVHAGEVIATGWGGNRLAAVNEQRTYDYNGDNATDFVARRNSDGTAYLYPGTGSGAHGTRVSWGTVLKGMTLIATAGDMNGDGFDDVLARTSGGTLYLYPGTGSGTLNTAGRITIGTGWNAMSTITGGHDYNSDGKADALAVQSSNGTLYLYPGKGDGTFGSRIPVGSSGWNAMREVTAVSDLDHDGHADTLAVRSSDGCLYFYGGTGSGTFKTKVKLGCGWNAMDAVTGVGDFNRDGHIDWMARRKSDGSLFLYPGNGAGNHGAAKLVGSGWNSMMIA